MAALVTPTVETLMPLGSDFFASGIEGPATTAHARDLVAQADVLHTLELHQPSGTAETFIKPSLRVAAWNLERCKHVEASEALLRRSGADICLLSEMDNGMARSSNLHTTRELAKKLGTGYLFGVEFIEFGLGTPEEEERFKGQKNILGLHGNAILSPLPMRDNALLPLDDGTIWYGLNWHHRRIGGRNAILTSIECAHMNILFISTHFETLTKPEGRRAQIDLILEELAKRGQADHVVIAGDFNTATLPDIDGMASHPDWFEAPEIFEPMFTSLREAGFEWLRGNDRGQTRRRLDDGRPPPVLRRIDWFFTKGLEVSNPQIWPAVDEAGNPLSDHEMISLDISLVPPRV
ncbi:endonuclease/exonuclease/phosphatase family protein [Beijerinckia indica]|uniref:Endonuclease/exonuclease/phosphatase n=1 Tax=Beijerinckia indica subsp. indica (strain ATCC 9039 / DSM 1715 / NCIMB 8712) TaxID=395963 RepID=B2IEJ9_BEII9|nr:endonuclease/exonuclease/phosphatase family protein [Beijerinckia indica]ACB96941.1 Endonuclease/exonuclease/phosphatase [Beijerinckia indica subsp. indica ATCC 9039]